MGVTIVQGALGGFDDVRRCREIGLADLQMDDVPPLGLELAGLGEHLKRGFGADLVHPLGEFHPMTILSRRTDRVLRYRAAT